MTLLYRTASYDHIHHAYNVLPTTQCKSICTIQYEKKIKLCYTLPCMVLMTLKFLPHVKILMLYLTSPEAETFNTRGPYHWATK